VIEARFTKVCDVRSECEFTVQSNTKCFNIQQLSKRQHVCVFLCTWVLFVCLCMCVHAHASVYRCVCECVHLCSLCLYASMFVCVYVICCEKREKVWKQGHIFTEVIKFDYILYGVIFYQLSFDCFCLYRI